MNQVIIHNLNEQFELIDGYKIPNVFDIKFSGESRSYDVYQTPRVSNPTFRKNRFGGQTIVLDIVLEKDVIFQYHSLKKKIEDRGVIEIEGILFDYTSSKFGQIDFTGKRFGSFSLELEVGMAYNIVEAKGGDTLLADRDIGDYYLKFNSTGEVQGFGAWFTIIEADAEINSVTNSGWYAIENKYIPAYLWDMLPIEGIHYTVDSIIDIFRYKHYF